MANFLQVFNLLELPQIETWKLNSPSRFTNSAGVVKSGTFAHFTWSFCTGQLEPLYSDILVVVIVFWMQKRHQKVLPGKATVVLQRAYKSVS